MKQKGRGRPKLPDAERVNHDGLYPHQKKMIREEAKIQGLSIAQMHRKIVDWYFEAHEPNTDVLLPASPIEVKQPKPRANQSKSKLKQKQISKEQ